MENTISFLELVIIVFALLQILLFFKIWGMTNDVREIKKQLEKKLKQEESVKN